MISNVFDAETKKPLGNVKDKHIIEKDGLKIGLIGLVEFEWITTLSSIDSDDIIYESYIDVGKRLCQELKGNLVELICFLNLFSNKLILGM